MCEDRLPILDMLHKFRYDPGCRKLHASGCVKSIDLMVVFSTCKLGSCAFIVATCETRFFFFPTLVRLSMFAPVLGEAAHSPSDICAWPLAMLLAFILQCALRRAQCCFAPMPSSDAEDMSCQVFFLGCNRILNKQFVVYQSYM